MRTIPTFERFRRLIRSWARGTIPFVGVVGRPGIGKTEEYTALLDGVAHHLFRGRTSALRIYREVRDAPDLPIVFDDVARLFRDPDALDIMKQIADSKPVRTIRWRTQTLPDDERQFDCESTVLVVLNSVPKNDSDVAAILDRFDVVTFAPSKPEIIQRMRTFAKNQLDVDIIASCDVMPSLRTLKHFEQWKASELDEIEELYSECGVSDAVATITRIMAEHDRPEWITEYQTLSGKSYEAAKRTWSRHRAEAEQLLRARGISPNGCPNVPILGNHEKNDGSAPVNAEGEDRKERQGTKGQLPGEVDSGWDPNWMESMSRSSVRPSGALDFETPVASVEPDLATEIHVTEARVICTPKNVAPREKPSQANDDLGLGIDWTESCRLTMPKPPVLSPKEEKERRAKKREKRILEKLEKELALDSVEDMVDGLAHCFEGDPEGMFVALAGPKACSSLGILRAMKNSVRDIDYTNIDKLLLMEYVMEEGRYAYAFHAKLAIGNIIGHKHMRIVRVRGIKYWQASPSRDMFG